MSQSLVTGMPRIKLGTGTKRRDTFEEAGHVKTASNLTAGISFISPQLLESNLETMMTTQVCLSEVNGGPVSLPQTSLFAYLEPALRRNPHAPATVVMHQPKDHLQQLVSDETDSTREESILKHGVDHLVWTYRQLHTASMHVANACLLNGLRRGCSTMVSFLPNGVEFPLLLWTSFLLKASLSTLDVGALSPPRAGELKSYLSSLNPDFILVPDAQGATAVNRALAELELDIPSVRVIVDVLESRQNVPEGWSSFLDFGASSRAQDMKCEAEMIAEARDDDLERISVTLFTSGTSSGQPKGCPRSVRNTMQFLERMLWLEEGGSSARNMVQTANFRVIAHVTTLQTWKAGGSIIMPSAVFDGGATLEAISVHQVSLLNLVPSQLHSIISHPDFSTTDVKSVQVICLGADMITKDLLQKTAKAFPQVPNIMTIHGMTEGGGLCKNTYGRDIEKRPFFGGIAPMGVVPQGMTLRIVESRSRDVTKRGVPGEMHLCCNSVIKSYLDNARPQDFYRDQHGQWFKTGDQGMMDEGGVIYVLGRTKDIIKRAGVPIVPAAIENSIERLTMTVCSVIGMPHPTLGQEPFAVVQSYGGVDEIDLKRNVLNEFGQDHVLAGAASLEQLGLKQFPLNATGKILKTELKVAVGKFLKRRA